MNGRAKCNLIMIKTTLDTKAQSSIAQGQAVGVVGIDARLILQTQTIIDHRHAQSNLGVLQVLKPHRLLLPAQQVLHLR